MAYEPNVEFDTNAVRVNLFFTPCVFYKVSELFILIRKYFHVTFSMLPNFITFFYKFSDQKSKFVYL